MTFIMVRMFARLPGIVLRPVVMRWIGWIGVALGCFFAFRAESAPAIRFQFVEPHMATLWTITCYAIDADHAREAAAAAFKRVDELERVMTDYDPDSELLRFCRLEPNVPHPISPDLRDIFEASQKISAMSGGVFDITVGNLVQVWRRARRQREFPSLERIQAAQSVTGWKNLVVRPSGKLAFLKRSGMRLDVGGIAKGFAADAALAVLRAHGAGCAMVAASGDFAVGDAPPGEPGWRIQIGDPSGRGEVLPQVLRLHHVGISTSGDTEQFVELGGVRYSHIVDPRTGVGVTNRMQATVIAENATRSDALATAVCILGERDGLKMIERDRRLAVIAFLKGREGEGYRTVKSSRFPKALAVGP